MCENTITNSVLIYLPYKSIKSKNSFFNPNFYPAVLSMLVQMQIVHGQYLYAPQNRDKKEKNYEIEP